MQFQTIEDVVICRNCAFLIANGDCLECVDAVRPHPFAVPKCTHGPDDSCDGWTIAVNEEDNGWTSARCWSCGIYQEGDGWYSATAFQYTAEYLAAQARVMLRLARLARLGDPGSEELTSTPAGLLARAGELRRLAVKARAEYNHLSV